MLKNVYVDLYIDMKPIGNIVSIDVDDGKGAVSFDFAYSDLMNLQKIDSAVKAYREIVKGNK